MDRVGAVHSEAVQGDRQGEGGPSSVLFLDCVKECGDVGRVLSIIDRFMAHHPGCNVAVICGNRPESVLRLLTVARFEGIHVRAPSAMWVKQYRRERLRDRPCNPDGWWTKEQSLLNEVRQNDISMRHLDVARYLVRRV